MPRTPPPLRGVIVGYGHMGRLHGKRLSEREDARLVAVIDPVPPPEGEGVPWFSVLDALEPRAVVSIHPLDLDAMGAAPGDIITVASRRGEVALNARADEGTPRGSVFIPFAFYEAAANRLTNPALDPFGKIAELKYCAVRVTKGGTLTELASYGGGQSFTEGQPA